ncbi:ferrochelatase [Marinilabiliaceae bacterium JC040]|nr:ferrochelatase [Marinilabiliaceae bacterium JC040]
MNKALLIINLGSPRNSDKDSVKQFLSEFLNDKYVIDIPYIARKILVNGIIIPKRLDHSTSLYKQLFSNDESPILKHTKTLCRKLNESIRDTDTFFAMRYGDFSIEDVLNNINKKGYKDITILPLYPQYADSTSRSTIEEVIRISKQWDDSIKIRIINEFYTNSLFIKAIGEKIKKYNHNKYDKILFSYHALPMRHIKKMHNRNKHLICSCTNNSINNGELCYLAACYKTSNLLAKYLNLDKNSYTTSFQSRMSKNWTKPFTSETIIDFANNHIKKILVVSPSFVCDCLETTIELQKDAKELFISNGGEKLDLVENLNSDDLWVDAIADIIK